MINNNTAGFLPELAGFRMSRDYINPGETLFITLKFRNRGMESAPDNYRFALDFVFGHQRKLENREFIYRSEAGSVPGTSKWAPQSATEVTVRWDAAVGWSGTYEITARILDAEGSPQKFFVEGAGHVKSHKLHQVNVGWNLGRPWVAENAAPVEINYANGKIAADASAPKTLEKAGNDGGGVISLRGQFEVRFANDEPRVVSIDGADFLCAAPEVAVKRLESGAEALAVFSGGPYGNNPAGPRCAVSYSLNFSSSDEARYMGLVRYEGAFAAAFIVRAKLTERILTLSVTDINETPGYELLSVKYPTLAEIEGGCLLDFFGGGRLVPIGEAIPCFYEKRYDVRNAAALFNENRMYLVESLHIDSHLTTGVFNAGGANRGFVGGSIICKIPAEGSAPGIPVKKPPEFTVELVPPKPEPFGWTDAAKYFRRGLKPNSAFELYRDCYLYKQLSTWGPQPDEKYKTSDRHPLTQNLFRSVSFSQIADNVRKFSNLTDGARQIMYITGFQKGGFDNAYPYPYDTDERCGSLSDLGASLESIRGYNAVAGLHDNFDDVSATHAKSFPHVAHDKAGNLWRGWVWAAGQTYMTSFVPYAESGDIARRVAKMNELLPLADSYHIDVLTAETCRYDFNPECPASASDSFEAKMEVVKEFNKYGIDVTSELLTHPSVGHIGFALHSRLDRHDVFIPGDSFVPLTAMVYHGTIGYTAGSGSRTDMLWGLLIGAQVFYEEDIAGELCVSRFYIQNVPAMKLYGRQMTDFCMNEAKARADYGAGSYVEVDFEAETYLAAVDGVVIGKNFTTLIPAFNTKNAFLAYSMNGEPVEYELPASVPAGSTIRAVTLTAEGDGEPISDAAICRGGRLELKLPPMRPVKLYAG